MPYLEPNIFIVTSRSLEANIGRSLPLPLQGIAASLEGDRPRRTWMLLERKSDILDVRDDEYMR